ncbi:MAG: polymer-forming cytoskeletal protein [Chloroflexota bacterium]
MRGRAGATPNSGVMMRARRNFLVFATAVIVVLGLALLLRPQMAQRAVLDKGVILTSDYHLSSAHSGDLVVLGDTLQLGDESVVAGSAALIGDTVLIDGVVDHDLTVIGDNITLSSTAHIRGNVRLLGDSFTIAGRVDGDVTLNGDNLTIDPNAQISGTISACVEAVDNPQGFAIACTSPSIEPFATLIALRSSVFHEMALGGGVRPTGMLVLTVFGSLALMGTSVLAVTFFPRRISHIEEAMRARPRSFVGVGIASYALIIGLFFALTFLLAIFPPLGFLLVPIFLIVGLMLLILSLSGLVTLAVILGDWLLSRVSRVPMPPLIAAVVGSLTLSLVLAGISLLPFGYVISFVLLGAVSSVGLGASLFTRIGARPVGRTYFVQG